MKFREPNDIPGGLSSLVKLKDKESVAGIMRGDLHEFFVKWENGKPKEVPEGTPGSSFRFRVNIVVKEGAVYVPKIFEQGVVVYKALAELHKDWPLDKTIVKITRSGSSINDTTYTVMPLPQTVPQETLNHIATIKLNDLSGKESGGSNVPWPHEETQHATQYAGPDDEIPF